MKIQIAPSILSADFGRLNEEIASVEQFADLLHVDVMDGHFVPNITIGSPVVRCIKSKLPLDCHLMIEQPEKYIEDFVKAGASSITVHQEVCRHLHRVIQQIKGYKIVGGGDAQANGSARVNDGVFAKPGDPVRAAVSINPGTPVETIFEVLDDVDMVLVMSVNPGFGGQKFIENALKKIETLRKMKPNLDIEVDGGINAETAKLCIKAGANILVAGSYIFGAEDRKKAIERLRGAS